MHMPINYNLENTSANISLIKSLNGQGKHDGDLDSGGMSKFKVKRVLIIT